MVSPGWRGQSRRKAGGEAADVAGCCGDRLPAEPADLVVLGGEPGYRQCPELLEVAEGGVAVGELLPEFVVVCFEPGYLGVSRVGGGSARAERGEPPLEFFFQVRVAPVERCAGDPGLAGQGGDVAFPVWRDVAAQEGVGGCPDPLLGLASLFSAGPHGRLLSLPRRVDGVQDALGAVEFGLEAGPLGCPGPAERADERGGAGDGVRPDGPVAGMVGGLRAAGRVAHSGQRLAGGGGSGHLQAERPGRVGEPAVVRRGEVQYLGALAEQVQDVLVAGDDAGGGCLVAWPGPRRCWRRTR